MRTEAGARRKWASFWDNRSSGFPTDTNLAVKPLKMARGLKFCIFRKERDCTIRVPKTKALISFSAHQLICVFVFAYAKIRFSHVAAQIKSDVLIDKAIPHLLCRNSRSALINKCLQVAVFKLLYQNYPNLPSKLRKPAFKITQTCLQNYANLPSKLPKPAFKIMQTCLQNYANLPSKLPKPAFKITQTCLQNYANLPSKLRKPAFKITQTCLFKMQRFKDCNNDKWRFFFYFFLLKIQIVGSSNKLGQNALLQRI